MNTDILLRKYVFLSFNKPCKHQFQQSSSPTGAHLFGHNRLFGRGIASLNFRLHCGLATFPPVSLCCFSLLPFILELLSNSYAWAASLSNLYGPMSSRWLIVLSPPVADSLSHLCCCGPFIACGHRLPSAKVLLKWVGSLAHRYAFSPSCSRLRTSPSINLAHFTLIAYSAP